LKHKSIKKSGKINMLLFYNTRGVHNVRIAEARFRIAKDMGLAKGTFSGLDYEWDEKSR
jgi:hypothetical protein